MEDMSSSKEDIYHITKNPNTTQEVSFNMTEKDCFMAATHISALLVFYLHGQGWMEIPLDYDAKEKTRRQKNDFNLTIQNDSFMTQESVSLFLRMNNQEII